MPWDDDLQGIIKDIAGSNNSPIRVRSGPGTGKSFALQRRVQRLLEEGEDPSKILAVTFTRNAAKNLIDDLNNLNISGCTYIQASTLHAYAFSLLLKEHVFQYINRNPRPLVGFISSGVIKFEYDPLLNDLKYYDKHHNNHFGSSRVCTKRIRAFEAAWAKLQHESPGWPDNVVDLEFNKYVTEWLSFHDSILIGELIPLALKYLRNNPASDEYRRFNHILIDEYQDLNKAEQTLLDLLSSNCKILVIGDADQSIYSFRFAYPDGINNFAQTHSHTHDYPLQFCRRCPTNIVYIANNLIKQNYQDLQTDRLHSFPGQPNGDLFIVQWDTLEDEANGIVSYCRYLINNHYNPKDILILTPRRIMGYRIKRMFKNYNVPCHSFYHESLLSDEIAQYNFALLTLLNNRDDKVALRYLLGFGSSTYRSNSYSKLRDYCLGNNLSPWYALENIASNNHQIPYITNSLLPIYLNIRNKLDFLESLSILDLINNLFPLTDPWCDEIREVLSVEGIDSCNRIYNKILNYVTQPESPEMGGYLSIMSLHKSKGLSKPVVIICGCNEGLIPTYKNDDPDLLNTIKEQRRLFYVSSTRCTDKLIFSSILNIEWALAKQIGARVRGQRMITSRFIDDLGPSAPTPITGYNWLRSFNL